MKQLIAYINKYDFAVTLTFAVLKLIDDIVQVF